MGIRTNREHLIIAYFLGIMVIASFLIIPQKSVTYISQPIIGLFIGFTYSYYRKNNRH
tara:strand:- start:549 stop:722 length:174 start_codon:yes stop_codon:yes gene_type:complete